MADKFPVVGYKNFSRAVARDYKERGDRSKSIAYKGSYAFHKKYLNAIQKLYVINVDIFIAKEQTKAAFDSKKVHPDDLWILKSFLDSI